MKLYIAVAAAAAFFVLVSFLSAAHAQQAAAKATFNVNTPGYVIVSNSTLGYGCAENTTVTGSPSFSLIGIGTIIEARQNGATTEITQRTGEKFIIAVMGSCSNTGRSIGKIRDIVDDPYEGVLPVQYSSQIIARYPFDITGDFSKSGTFTINLQNTGTAVRVSA